jgi:hypothetical protein
MCAKAAIGMMATKKSVATIVLKSEAVKVRPSRNHGAELLIDGRLGERFTPTISYWHACQSPPSELQEVFSYADNRQ